MPAPGMGAPAGCRALAWALAALLLVQKAETQGNTELSWASAEAAADGQREAVVPAWLSSRSDLVFSAAQHMIFIPPITVFPTMSPANPVHNGRVCSTWGDFHYKTFDGDIFRFPGLCNYVFSAHCGAAYEDFNIQLRRSLAGSRPTITHVVLKTQGLVVEISNGSVLINGQREDLPYSRAGLVVEQTSIYVKVNVRLALTFMWNGEDSALLELDPKYANQTCGLCGDFNGLPAINEFYAHNARLTPVQFGNLQKLDGPTEQCQDPLPSPADNCTDEEGICRRTLLGPAFAQCNGLVDTDVYVAACTQDLCRCPTCPCATFAEYSRQCAHAGGQPQNWRGPDFCPQMCPLSLQHQECGSPCADTCSNPEHSQLCEDHCVDGCFCPPGTVLDDVTHTGCLPLERCSCTHGGRIYAPGASFTTSCSSCTCSRGLWQCQDVPCPGTCSVQGGSHVSTYDEKLYDVHGDCSYILSKKCADSSFTVLAELRKCGLTDNENCLKTVTLRMTGSGDTAIQIQANGGVFMNSIYTQLPVSAANITIFRPSSFFILVQTGLGLQLQVQLVPLMQVYLRLDPSYRGQMCGLCGNFNQNQADDFRILGGVVEGTAAPFANTWKTQAACPNVKNSFEDPCSLSVENENYAQHWCSLLTHPAGAFSPCHTIVNPAPFHSNCMFDTCNCEKSEACMCAALSSYVRACAAKGVLLRGWRDSVCTKYMSSCPKSQTYAYVVDGCQPTCRSLSQADVTCGIAFVPVDGCTCPSGTFLDDAGACVPAEACPCYFRGSVVAPGEVVHDDGVVCSCVSGKLSCLGAEEETSTGCVAPMVYLDCRNASAGTPGAECLRSCHMLDVDCFSTHCVSGCVCPPGLVSDGSGGCVAEEDCPCLHNEATYKPGETIRVDCNTCTCRSRRWECSHRPCLGTCVAYGDGHFITFDGERYSFEGSCEYTLAQDHCGGNGTTNGTFHIISENVPCGTTGVTCSKAIKLFLENYELILHEGTYKVVQRGSGGDLPYKIRYMGIYLTVETRSGMVVSWDRKTSVFIRLRQDYKGRVCGLCGNFDDNAVNDFTTRSQSVVGNALEFGNSWKFSPSCPDASAPKDPCTANPYRKSWAQKQCSIINSATFAACRSQVDSTKYYDACVSDACACNSGGDCECFCTAVAAYAQACRDVGVCVTWRTPDICPLFCDYYNPRGECEWHYEPCGAPCLRTCRNPSGHCLLDLPGLEGCYPRCPPSKPFFSEDQMECVAQCGCYDEDGNYHEVGSRVPTAENCQSCDCTPGGLQCTYNLTACTCTYEGKTYGYGDVIYNTTDGLGACLTAICGNNGTIIRRVVECPGTVSTTPFTFTTTAAPLSTTGPAPTISTVCVHKQCRWSDWYDSGRPEPGMGGGDIETFVNLRQRGHQVCPAPEGVECRAQQLPDKPLQELGQKVECDMARGLTCLNSEQSPPLCHNYELRVLCCDYVPCGTSSALGTSPSPSPGITTWVSTLKSLPTPTQTTSTRESPLGSTAASTSQTPPAMPATTETQEVGSSSTPAATTCQPKCQWTGWFDEDYPKSEKAGGDIESYDRIRSAGGAVCERPQEIECRAVLFPSMRLEDLGQRVHCDPRFGLVCRNEEQEGMFKMCFNYKIRMLCCSYSHCGATASTATATASTATATTTTTTAATSTATATSTTTASTATATTTMPPATETGTWLGSSPGVTTVVPFLSTRSTSQATSLNPSHTATHRTSATRSLTAPPGSTKPTTPERATSVLPTRTTLQGTTGGTSQGPTSRAHATTGAPASTAGTISTSPPPTSRTKTSTSGAETPTGTLVPTATTEANTNQGTTSCQPKCEWTEWFDVDFPTSGVTGGDMETYDNIRAAGGRMCAEPKSIECRAENYPEVSIDRIGQVVSCSLQTGLVCRNEDQQGNFNMCFNYNIRVLCCDYGHCPSTPATITVTPPGTSLGLTSPTPSGTNAQSMTTPGLSTGPSTATSGCQLSCHWTNWLDSDQPFPGYNGGDIETYYHIVGAGGQLCLEPVAIECEAVLYPEIPLGQLGQVVQCNVDYGLICRNSWQRGGQTCLNYHIRVRCCDDYSHCPSSAASETTTPSPRSSTTSTGRWSSGVTGVRSTATTQIHLSSTRTRETGPSSPRTTQSVSIPTAETGPSSSGTTQTVSTTQTPLTSLRTTEVTTTLPSSSPLPSSFTSTPATSPSEGCRPQCAWTDWLDQSYPVPGASGGDFETYANLRATGEAICQQPLDLECRAETQPNVPVQDLGQVVQCNLSFGLVCHNRDQSGPFKLCLNYHIRVFCCNYSHCLSTPATTTLSPQGTSLGLISPAATSTTAQPPTSPSTAGPSTSPSTATSGCQPACHWTDWLDSDRPLPGRYRGDIETYYHIVGRGGQLCLRPVAIECEAVLYPEIPLGQLGQVVQCNVDYGLICRNSWQSGGQTCLNYHIRVRCCDDYSHCPSSAASETTTPSPRLFTTSTSTGRWSSGVTGTTLPSSSPPPSSFTSTPATSPSEGCRPQCAWTDWLDQSYPVPGASGGDFETYANLRATGEAICQQPLDLECRAETQPNVPVQDLGQVVQCNLSFGLVCHNRDQSGPFKLCLNYHIRVFCCNYSHCLSTPATTTLSPQGTSLGLISPAATSTTAQPPTSPSTAGPSTSPSTATSGCQPACHWTDWLDSDRPLPGRYRGDIETYYHIVGRGGQLCLRPVAIECEAVLYPEIPLGQLGQVVQCNVDYGLICRNSWQSGGQTCLNYHIRVRCCDDYSHCPSSAASETTTPSPRSSTTSTSTGRWSSGVTGTTLPSSSPPPSSLTSTPATSPSEGCRPQCAWTDWLDQSYPVPGASGGDFETYANLRATGEAICQQPLDLECRAETQPNVPVQDLGQVVQCNLSFGLVCHNRDQSGPFKLCLNYHIRVLCCNYSHCLSTPATTTLSPQGTSLGLTSPAATSTTAQPPTSPSTAGPSTSPSTATSGCQPACHWTDWLDSDRPLPGRYRGDIETYYHIVGRGGQLCLRPVAIECEAVLYPEIPLGQLGQVVQCNVDYGLICRNSWQSGGQTCLNYHIRVRCCDDYSHCPSSAASETTTPSPRPSTTSTGRWSSGVTAVWTTATTQIHLSSTGTRETGPSPPRTTQSVSIPTAETGPSSSGTTHTVSTTQTPLTSLRTTDFTVLRTETGPSSHGATQRVSSATTVTVPSSPGTTQRTPLPIPVTGPSSPWTTPRVFTTLTSRASLSTTEKVTVPTPATGTFSPKTNKVTVPSTETGPSSPGITQSLPVTTTMTGPSTARTPQKVIMPTTATGPSSPGTKQRLSIPTSVTGPSSPRTTHRVPTTQTPLTFLSTTEKVTVPSPVTGPFSPGTTQRVSISTTETRSSSPGTTQRVSIPIPVTGPSSPGTTQRVSIATTGTGPSTPGTTQRVSIPTTVTGPSTPETTHWVPTTQTPLTSLSTTEKVTVPISQTRPFSPKTTEVTVPTPVTGLSSPGTTQGFSISNTETGPPSPGTTQRVSIPTTATGPSTSGTTQRVSIPTTATGPSTPGTTQRVTIATTATGPSTPGTTQRVSIPTTVPVPSSPGTTHRVPTTQTPLTSLSTMEKVTVPTSQTGPFSPKTTKVTVLTTETGPSSPRISQSFSISTTVTGPSTPGTTQRVSMSTPVTGPSSPETTQKYSISTTETGPSSPGTTQRVSIPTPVTGPSSPGSNQRVSISTTGTRPSSPRTTEETIPTPVTGPSTPRTTQQVSIPTSVTGLSSPGSTQRVSIATNVTGPSSPRTTQRLSMTTSVTGPSSPGITHRVDTTQTPLASHSTTEKVTLNNTETGPSSPGTTQRLSITTSVTGHSSPGTTHRVATTQTPLASLSTTEKVTVPTSVTGPSSPETTQRYSISTTGTGLSSPRTTQRVSISTTETGPSSPGTSQRVSTPTSDTGPSTTGTTQTVSIPTPLTGRSSPGTAYRVPTTQKLLTSLSTTEKVTLHITETGPSSPGTTERLSIPTSATGPSSPGTTHRVPTTQTPLASHSTTEKGTVPTPVRGPSSPGTTQRYSISTTGTGASSPRTTHSVPTIQTPLTSFSTTEKVTLPTSQTGSFSPKTTEVTVPTTETGSTSPGITQSLSITTTVTGSSTHRTTQRVSIPTAVTGPTSPGITHRTPTTQTPLTYLSTTEKVTLHITETGPSSPGTTQRLSITTSVTGPFSPGTTHRVPTTQTPLTSLSTTEKFTVPTPVTGPSSPVTTQRYSISTTGTGPSSPGTTHTISTIQTPLNSLSTTEKVTVPTSQTGPFSPKTTEVTVPTTETGPSSPGTTQGSSITTTVTGPSTPRTTQKYSIYTPETGPSFPGTTQRVSIPTTVTGSSSPGTTYMLPSTQKPLTSLRTTEKVTLSITETGPSSPGTTQRLSITTSVIGPSSPWTTHRVPITQTPLASHSTMEKVTVPTPLTGPSSPGTTQRFSIPTRVTGPYSTRTTQSFSIRTTETGPFSSRTTHRIPTTQTPLTSHSTTEKVTVPTPVTGPSSPATTQLSSISTTGTALQSPGTTKLYSIATTETGPSSPKTTQRLSIPTTMTGPSSPGTTYRVTTSQTPLTSLSTTEVTVPTPVRGPSSPGTTQRYSISTTETGPSSPGTTHSVSTIQTPLNSLSTTEKVTLPTSQTGPFSPKTTEVTVPTTETGPSSPGTTQSASITTPVTGPSTPRITQRYSISTSETGSSSPGTTQRVSIPTTVTAPSSSGTTYRVAPTQKPLTSLSTTEKVTLPITETGPSSPSTTQRLSITTSVTGPSSPGITQSFSIPTTVTGPSTPRTTQRVSIPTTETGPSSPRTTHSVPTIQTPLTSLGTTEKVTLPTSQTGPFSPKTTEVTVPTTETRPSSTGITQSFSTTTTVTGPSTPRTTQRVSIPTPETGSSSSGTTQRISIPTTVTGPTSPGITHRIPTTQTTLTSLRTTEKVTVPTPVTGPSSPVTTQRYSSSTTGTGPSSPGTTHTVSTIQTPLNSLSTTEKVTVPTSQTGLFSPKTTEVTVPTTETGLSSPGTTQSSSITTAVTGPSTPRTTQRYSIYTPETGPSYPGSTQSVSIPTIVTGSSSPGTTYRLPSTQKPLTSLSTTEKITLPITETGPSSPGTTQRLSITTSVTGPSFPWTTHRVPTTQTPLASHSTTEKVTVPTPVTGPSSPGTTQRFSISTTETGPSSPGITQSFSIPTTVTGPSTPRTTQRVSIPTTETGPSSPGTTQRVPTTQTPLTSHSTTEKVTVPTPVTGPSSPGTTQLYSISITGTGLSSPGTTQRLSIPTPETSPSSPWTTHRVPTTQTPLTSLSTTEKITVPTSQTGPFSPGTTEVTVPTTVARPFSSRTTEVTLPTSVTGPSSPGTTRRVPTTQTPLASLSTTEKVTVPTTVTGPSSSGTTERVSVTSPSSPLGTQTTTVKPGTPSVSPAASLVTSRIWTTPAISSSLPQFSVSTTAPSILTTLRPTAFSSPPISTTACFCQAFGRLFLPGDVIYNKTDSAGCQFYAICNQHCDIDRFPGACPTSSPLETSKTPAPPTSQPPGCDLIFPPRQVNESWTLEDCTVARCEGKNRIILLGPQPVANITCVNGHLPVKVWSEKERCAYRLECECSCSGWGDSHYTTFDGTSYSFWDNCTHVLMREIRPRDGNLSIYINNYYCGAAAATAHCPRALIVHYESMKIILTTTTAANGQEKSLILFDQRPVGEGFSKNGVNVSVTGTTMMRIDIPAIGVSITFDGRVFQAQLSYSHFNHNTEGLCGTCTNSQTDDCRRSDGTVAPTCKDMASSWLIPDSSKESCRAAPPPTSPPPSTPTMSASTTCPPAPLCTLMLSQVFAECHGLIPPGPFFSTCISDHCQASDPCQSLEAYAVLCRARGVCSNWRNATGGLCELTCPPAKVYKPCGPAQAESCDSRSQSPVNKRLAEGCFCPDGHILFNSYTDVCVPQCSCVGPDGFPKLPGEQWVSNCQDCVCDKGSVSVQCVPVQCKAQDQPPQCSQAGFVTMTRPLADNPCCQETLCVCNVTTCPRRPPTCGPREELTSTQNEGDCCPTFHCRPKLCTYNGTFYGVGATFPGVKPCHTCTCLSTDTQNLTVQCEENACNTPCPQGFEHSKVAGQCCGECVQTACLTPDGRLVQPNETWVSSPVDNCTEYRCQETNGLHVLILRPAPCPEVSSCMGVLRKSGCCYSCEEELHSCRVRVNRTVLRLGDCTSGAPVNVSSCEGSCPGVSAYSLEAQAMQRRCTCCQETRAHEEAVTLQCPNGTAVQHTYIHVDACSCTPSCAPSPEAPEDSTPIHLL
ncbi:mucin-5B [Diceros bicornis minor]|uniref:mucin-5B n=1 Tax=Diceros bicornis minor TaxID=77932 RepID=UPI0026ED5995|nr:mucin-5B [Diceros bicornis minor]